MSWFRLIILCPLFALSAAQASVSEVEPLALQLVEHDAKGFPVSGAEVLEPEIKMLGRSVQNKQAVDLKEEH